MGKFTSQKVSQFQLTKNVICGQCEAQFAMGYILFQVVNQMGDHKQKLLKCMWTQMDTKLTQV